MALNQRIAVIDIGSNSIRYMEAERTGHGFSFGKKQVITTRLASGLLSSGVLSYASMELTVHAIEAMEQTALAHGLPVYAYATSAVRDASNQAEFLSLLHDRCPNVKIQLLPGSEEARLAFLGAASPTGGLIDIGGGSSQVVTEQFARSFPLGCVRMKDLSCSATEYRNICSAAEDTFRKIYLLPEGLPRFFTAVGGTATTLAAFSLGLTVYDPFLVSTHVLTPDTLHKAILALDEMGAEQRRNHPLLTKRHDVILGGCAILEYLVNTIGIEQISFSDADGLEGYAMKLLDNDNVFA